MLRFYNTKETSADFSEVDMKYAFKDVLQNTLSLKEVAQTIIIKINMQISIVKH